jgi:Zn-dependent peptidase ImmA (M78 family)
MSQTKSENGASAVRAKPSNLEKTVIFGIAEKVAHQLKFDVGVDINSVVEQLGGRVEVKEFWGNASSTGALQVSDVGKFQIAIPMHTSQERDKFTIAHELGHYVLHYLLDSPYGDKPRMMTADRYGTGREEAEANWFAAAFLMPEKTFNKHYKAKSGSLYEVAKVFGVSTQAAEIRARALGLLNAQTTQ